LRLLAQSRVVLLELLETLEQVGRRVLALGVARRDALGDERLELRVGEAGHVAGSGGEAWNALPVAFAVDAVVLKGSHVRSIFDFAKSDERVDWAVCSNALMQPAYVSGTLFIMLRSVSLVSCLVSRSPRSA
jgi:hypothetical protein